MKMMGEDNKIFENNETMKQHSGEVTKRKLHGKVSEKDCLVKKQILSTLTHGNLKSRDLYNLSKYDGTYNRFTSNLSKYVSCGYVNKLGKRPSFYELTELGMENVKNPFAYRQMRVTIHNEKIGSAKNKNTEFQFVSVEGSGSGGCSVQYVDKPVSSRDFGDELDTHSENPENDKTTSLKSDIIKIKDSEIENLKNKNKELVDKGNSIITQKNIEINNLKSQLNLQDEYKKADRGVKYHSILMSKAGQTISEEDYNAIPFRFIRKLGNKGIKGMVLKKDAIRLESQNVAGKYVNNGDAEYVEFSRMTAKKPLFVGVSNTQKGYGFYYTHDLRSGGRYDITEITHDVYNKLVKPNNKQSGINQSNKQPNNAQQQRNQQNRR